MIDAVHKRNLASLTSTVEESKCHYYYYEHLGSELERDKTLGFKNKNEPILSSRFSHHNFDKSPVNSEGMSRNSRDFIVE